MPTVTQGLNCSSSQSVSVFRNHALFVASCLFVCRKGHTGILDAHTSTPTLRRMNHQHHHQHLSFQAGLSWCSSITKGHPQQDRTRRKVFAPRNGHTTFLTSTEGCSGFLRQEEGHTRFSSQGGKDTRRHTGLCMHEATTRVAPRVAKNIRSRSRDEFEKKSARVSFSSPCGLCPCIRTARKEASVCTATRAHKERRGERGAREKGWLVVASSQQQTFRIPTAS